ncbi:MAG TPA: AAA family ATPase [Lachnospiraceae bacterium]|nr:AAA family ATPase [Lachnospiraceae bacterium]
MYLTITGKLGSGKSTVCKYLAEKYGFEIYSTGTVQRKIAREMGISTLDLNELMRKNSKYDDLIDNETVRIAKENRDKNLIFDSRMAFHFVDDSYDIFTTIDPVEAARRVSLMPRGVEEQFATQEEAEHELLERARIENIRFKEIYHVDNQDYNNYSLIIDTSWASPSELGDIIYKTAIDPKNAGQHLVLISPRSLYPTKPFGGLDIEKVGRLRQPGAADDTAEMIEIKCYKNYHYVVKGHHRLAAALLDGKKFVKAVLAPAEAQEIQTGALGIEMLHEYEKEGDFQYISYPDTYRK